MSDTWQTLQAKNGTAVAVRPLTAQDAPHLVFIFDHMGSESRYRRFNQPMDDLTESRILQEASHMLATIPPDFGLLAFVDGEPIGAVRYVGIEVGIAEFAISLVDVWQGQGIGTQLVQALFAEARRYGLKKITAVVQSTNKPMLTILQKIDYPMQAQVDGADTYFEIEVGK